MLCRLLIRLELGFDIHVAASMSMLRALMYHEVVKVRRLVLATVVRAIDRRLRQLSLVVGAVGHVHLVIVR